MKKIVLFATTITITLFLVFAISEALFRWFIFTEGSTYQQIFEAFAKPENQPPYISQPYLNYINNPGYKDLQGNTEINSAGMRYHREVSFVPEANTLRILFLGGSTTFGDVDDTFEVFSSLIEKHLIANYLPKQNSFTKLEGINCGVHGLTSAELLTHFQFKYQYFSPHWLVLHTGFNDAFMYARTNDAPYQPDYHNSRRVFRDILDLSTFEKKMLWSRTFFYFMIRIRFDDYLKSTLEDNIFFHHTHKNIWYKSDDAPTADSSYNAFYNNLETLMLIAQKSQVNVLLVPEVCDTTKMPQTLRKPLYNGLAQHKIWMQHLAKQYGQHFLALPDSLFPPDVFLDDDGIHVNHKGEKVKAKLIGSELVKLLSNSKISYAEQ